MNYQYCFLISKILFEVNSRRPLEIDGCMRPFLTSQGGTAHIRIYISWNFREAPALPAQPAGADRVQTYYRRDGRNFCVLREDQKGPLAVTVCGGDYREFFCYINEAPFLCLPRTLGFVMRMLPVRSILQHQKVCFFHASQIALGSAGILFTAPSGTGKTTQARLWQKYRGARIVCNDRTLVREGRTYGFPLDGSEPVCSSEENRLGAIVVLGQSPENLLTRLRPSRAMQKLIPQLVVDVWDSQARELAAAQVLELAAGTPVYELLCTPDERAVQCLEEKLKSDGVIENGSDPGSAAGKSIQSQSSHHGSL